MSSNQVGADNLVRTSKFLKIRLKDLLFSKILLIFASNFKSHDA